MRSTRIVDYENLKTNYSYGSLAENIWDTAEQEEVAVPAPKKAAKKKINWGFFKRATKPLVKEETKVHPKAGCNYKGRLLKKVFFISGALFMGTYFSCVLFGNLAVVSQGQLVAMQREEMRLINEINEMQIAVEQLKGPERIREIASAKLGMVVAKDNVYVNASKSRTIGQVYGTKNSADMFVAMGK